MFKGKRIKLRSYKESDAERCLELIEAEGLRETLTPMVLFPYSLKEEKLFIDSAMEHKGNLYNFAIELIETGEYIGGCGINEYDEKTRVASIGIWLGKDYQQKGLGQETLRVLCKFIFDEVNTNKIKLKFYAFNEKGKKCYEAVGFKEEGVHRKELFRYGKYHDIISMGMFREEFIENLE